MDRQTGSEEMTDLSREDLGAQAVTPWNRMMSVTAVEVEVKALMAQVAIIFLEICLPYFIVANRGTHWLAWTVDNQSVWLTFLHILASRYGIMAFESLSYLWNGVDGACPPS